jgi:hypothetical protein
MSWEAVETVSDEAAAAIVSEALAEAEIPSQLRRLSRSPYGPAKPEIEVRVAAADAPRARALLAQLAEESEAAARSEAHGSVASEPAPTAPTGLWQSLSRSRRVAVLLSIALSLVTLLSLALRYTTLRRMTARISHHHQHMSGQQVN